MSTLTQFLNPLRSATSLRGFAYSASNYLPSSAVSDDPGALLAGTWKTAITVASPGILHGVIVRHGDSNSRTVGCRVTIDGVAVCTVDESVANGFANAGVCVGGASVGSTEIPSVFAPFKTLAIEVRASDATSAVRYLANYVVL